MLFELLDVIRWRSWCTLFCNSLIYLSHGRILVIGCKCIFRLFNISFFTASPIILFSVMRIDCNIVYYNSLGLLWYWLGIYDIAQTTSLTIPQYHTRTKQFSVFSTQTQWHLQYRIMLRGRISNATRMGDHSKWHFSRPRLNIVDLITRLPIINLPYFPRSRRTNITKLQ